MAFGQEIAQYVVFDAATLLSAGKDRFTEADIAGPVWRFLKQTKSGITQDDYRLRGVPYVEFHGGVVEPPRLLARTQEIFGVTSPCASAAKRFRDAVTEVMQSNKAFHAIGVDNALSLGEYSVPSLPDAAVFGSFEDARRLIHADSLPGDLDGRSVNVVVVDAGLDKRAIPRGQFGGGWRPCPEGNGLPMPAVPGETIGENALHGMMIVNDILALAPRATIFDVPLVPPPKLFDIFSFVGVADAVYRQIASDIKCFQQQGRFTGPWVFVNAWAVFDRRSEGPFLGEYTENKGPCMDGHPPFPFIETIEAVARDFDIAFCAGNCGEVCPDGRCGPDDYGPGRGIWGANADSGVLTTGAVRVDGIWAGYSSEGPGPTPFLCAQKPDLCAPSQFLGPRGLYPPSSGTSAAAAVATGVVAALRSRAGWDQTRISPGVLKLILNYTAKQTQGFGWDSCLGNGILDAGEAYRFLSANFK